MTVYGWALVFFLRCNAGCKGLRHARVFEVLPGTCFALVLLVCGRLVLQTKSSTKIRFRAMGQLASASFEKFVNL